MLSLKADISRFDKMGNNMLHYASKSGSRECIELLLKHGCQEVLAKNCEGKAPIDVSKSAKITAILKDWAMKSEEASSEKCIKIANVKNENFLVLNGELKTFRTDSSGSSNRSHHPIEEVGPRDFLIHALIGKGSFGEVFLVEKR